MEVIDNLNNKQNINDDKPIAVFSIYLLYKLSDAGLLHNLIGVAKSNKDEKKRVYFFNNREVRQVIDAYVAECKASITHC